ncbi:MAG TPA: hypothetical protein PLI09_18305 [Candidatus Hydrogenedentes bacterium]|nr:hypothetical protein [Candidatus Hydrogenedentota bacterium]
MGDASDHADIRRFLRSPEGRERLEMLRAGLVGRRIAAVEFLNDTHAVGILLHLEDGTAFRPGHTSLDVDTLRREFEGVLQREYYRDFPERRPAADADGRG